MTDTVEYAWLRSVDANGGQVVALTYNLSKCGERKRMNEYAKYESSRGHRVFIEFEYNKEDSRIR